MSSRLENELREYEKDSPITNDRELTAALEYILSKEESLPRENRDYDLIDEATEAALTLKGVDPETLDKYAEAAADKAAKEYTAKQKKSVRLKWLIPAAVIVTLLMIGTVAGYSLGYTPVDMIKALARKVVYVFDNKEVVITDDIFEFDTLDGFLSSGDYSGLLLTEELDKAYHVESVNIGDFGSYKDIAVTMKTSEGVHEIIIDTPGSGSFDALEPQNIGGIDVYVCEYDGKHQGQFTYNGDLYTVITTSYENLVNIIETMGGKQQ